MGCLVRSVPIHFSTPQKPPASPVDAQYEGVVAVLGAGVRGERGRVRGCGGVVDRPAADGAFTDGDVDGAVDPDGGGQRPRVDAADAERGACDAEALGFVDLIDLADEAPSCVDHTH
jgi:hypothetical protein